MLAPVESSNPSVPADFEALLEEARLAALTTLRRLLVDPPESAAAARELRMAASAILRIAPNPPPQSRPNQPRAPARADDSASSELCSQARGPAPKPAPIAQSTATDLPPSTQPTTDPFHGLSDDQAIRLAESILFPKRSRKSRAAALRANCGAASTHDSS